MKTENILSPQESILVITNAIAKTKENIAKNSFSFLLWGWLISIASFAFFILEQYTTFSFYFIPFPILVSLGIIISLLYYSKRKSRSTLTYIDHFLGKMWMVLGISFLVVVFMNVSQGHAPFTYTLLIAGIGTLVSGLVLRFKPLTAGGILFLFSALASIYINEQYIVLWHGFAVIGGYLIPGYLLKKSKA